MEREYLNVLRSRGSATPNELATALGVSEGCAVFWLTELAREGLVRITGIEAATPSSEDEHAPEHDRVNRV